MYIAAGRIADDFGCDIIGIQYQQGLKDMVPASDLAEGMLNNVDRPPIYHKLSKQELFKGKAIPHFNEVDEGAAVDALVTNRVWTALSLDPATTLHDVRYGEWFTSSDGKLTHLCGYLKYLAVLLQVTLRMAGKMLFLNDNLQCIFHWEEEHSKVLVNQEK